MTNKYMIEIAQHVNWNVPDNEEEAKAQIVRLQEGKEEVTVDIEKCFHIVKRFMNETYPTEAQEIEEQTGQTVYKALRGGEKEYGRMSLATCMMLMEGVITISDFMDLMRKDWLAKKFPFPLDAGEEWVKQSQNMGRILMANKGKVVEEETVTSTPSTLKLPTIDNDGMKKAIDSLLSTTVKDTSVTYDAIRAALDTSSDKITKASKSAREAKAEARKLAKEMEQIRQTLADMTVKSLMVQTVTEVEGDGSIPSGKLITKRISELFPDMKFDNDFDVPFWEWDGVHPHVPTKDTNYIFRPIELTRVLYSIITNQRMYLHGHTGSGKTTLIEQVAAHLNYPFVRINFDSEITRTDLIGRDTLTTDAEGRTISKFVDGILPTVMSGPYIACYDELDFVRPDVAYVMQSALEGNQLRITEDGDRIVKPHPMYRMFGTGNTVGQGDEHGMYSGARPQSLAFLDRFTVWLKVNYLDDTQREQLIKNHYPSLSPDNLKVITQYATEHLTAFMDGKIIQPISPRGMLAIARATVILGNVKEAISMTVLDRANGDDRTTLKGIIDRVTR